MVTNNIKELSEQMLEYYQELRTYVNYKQKFLSFDQYLFDEYQSGTLDYEVYRKRRAVLLKGKTREWWLNYYDSYILSLIHKIDTANEEIFYFMFRDKSYEHLSVHTAPIDQVAQLHETLQQERIKDVLESSTKTESPVTVSRELFRSGHDESLFQEFEDNLKRLLFHSAPAKQEQAHEPFFRRLLHRILPSKQSGSSEGGESFSTKLDAAIHKAGTTKGMQKNELQSVEDYFKTQSTQPGFKKYGFFGKLGLSLKNGIRTALGLNSEAFTFSDSSDASGTLLDLEARDEIKKLSKSLKDVSINSKTLREEAERIQDRRKKLVEEKPKKVSLYVVFANRTMKPITRFLVSHFPGFFKNLYDTLRFANINLLSNTYLNVMNLTALLVFFVSLIGFTVFSSILSPTFAQALARGFLMSLLSVAVTVVGFISYPHSKMNRRKVNIDSNMPFAINHMAAVVASGVSPVKMFELISDSKEYGEIGVECTKIVDYVYVFGYDISSALQSVSAITPSANFKEFIDGLISNLHTGTDLKDYMKQKADESMTQYSLERQKYLENVSTYSDIYTGILVAAPLFFITALSLVSMLGGTIGGMDITTVIGLGTYIVVPGLNVLFLIFLIMTQPQI
jgi:pilus assembly protein TadC